MVKDVIRFPFYDVPHHDLCVIHELFTDDLFTVDHPIGRTSPHTITGVFSKVGETSVVIIVWKVGRDP